MWGKEEISCRGWGKVTQGLRAPESLPLSILTPRQGTPSVTCSVKANSMDSPNKAVQFADSLSEGANGVVSAWVTQEAEPWLQVLAFFREDRGSQYEDWRYVLLRWSRQRTREWPALWTVLWESEPTWVSTSYFICWSGTGREKQWSPRYCSHLTGQAHTSQGHLPCFFFGLEMRVPQMGP